MRSNSPTREIGRQVDYEAMKRNAFEEQGIVVAKVDDPRLDTFERQFLKNIGNKIFGAK